MKCMSNDKVFDSIPPHSLSSALSTRFHRATGNNEAQMANGVSVVLLECGTRENKIEIIDAWNVCVCVRL